MKSSKLISLILFLLVFPLLSSAAPTLSLLSARDHIDGGFTAPQTVYADQDRIYLASNMSKLFVLSRDRATNFPIIETIQANTAALAGVIGDAQNVYVASYDGNLRVYRKDHPNLTLIATIPVAAYALSGIDIVGTNLYVARGQAHVSADPSGNNIYIHQWNPGDAVTRISTETLTITGNFEPPFIANTVASMDTQSGAVVGRFATNSSAIWANPEFVTVFSPGCCGYGMDTLLPGNLTPRQVHLSSPYANSMTRFGNLLLVGSEAGGVLVHQINSGIVAPWSQYLNLKQLTGHNNVEDIEIRSIWSDNYDNLVFGGSSFGNDGSRRPELPSFFVMEVTDGTSPTPTPIPTASPTPTSTPTATPTPSPTPTPTPTPTASSTPTPTATPTSPPTPTPTSTPFATPVPGAKVKLVTTRDNILGGFTTPQSVYADRDRIYLASIFDGTLFVLSRDRAANFPILEKIQENTKPLTSVRGDSQNIYVASYDGNVRVYRKDHPKLTLIATIPVASYSLISMGIAGKYVYVGRGQANVAVDPNGENLYIHQTNPGDSAAQISTETFSVTKIYEPSFVSDTTVSVNTQTGAEVGRASAFNTTNLYTDGNIVAGTTPGCCGFALVVYKAGTLKLIQNIWSPWANTSIRIGQWLIAGSEASDVNLYDLNQSPLALSETLNIRALLGRPVLDDIEIRSMWHDNYDNLIFAGTSWGADQTRGPTLPSLSILEFNDGPSPTPTPTPTPTPPTIRINSGDGEYTGTATGYKFSADQNYSGGSTWNWNKSKPISNTLEGGTLYQSVRYGTSFSYSIPVVSGGYTLRLRFMEGEPSYVGQSPFTVKVNDAPILKNFDVGSSAGGTFIALDKSYLISVIGQLTLSFTSDSPSGRAMVSAIELIPADQGPDDVHPPQPPSGTRMFGINAGDGVYFSPYTGYEFTADQMSLRGSKWVWGFTNPISNTQEFPALYKSVRYSTSNFQYVLPAVDGKYIVKLRFLEGDPGFAGKSPFSVLINGKVVLSHFDIATEAGGSYVALDKDIPVTVLGGTGVNVEFRNESSAGRAMVSALELISTN